MLFWTDSITRGSVFAAITALTACGATGVNPPVVADYNGASVKIHVPVQITPADLEVAFQMAEVEATRICKSGNHKRAEYASMIATPYSGVQRLYLCLD